jgi:hypothetical protein
MTVKLRPLLPHRKGAAVTLWNDRQQHAVARRRVAQRVFEQGVFCR